MAKKALPEVSAHCCSSAESADSGTVLLERKDFSALLCSSGQVLLTWNDRDCMLDGLRCTHNIGQGRWSVVRVPAIMGEAETPIITMVDEPAPAKPAAPRLSERELKRVQLLGMACVIGQCFGHTNEELARMKADMPEAIRPYFEDLLELATHNVVAVGDLLDSGPKAQYALASDGSIGRRDRTAKGPSDRLAASAEAPNR